MIIHTKSQKTTKYQLKITKTKAFAAIGMIAVLLSVLTVYSRPAKADQFDAQIAALKKQVQATQAAADAKAADANTLKGKIAGIQAEIDAAQHQLDLTNLEIKQTQARIDAANKELDHQKAILKDNLRTIYKQGDVSPIEVVASSRDLSDFVAQQEYLSAIKQKIDDNLKKIDSLKKELGNKKDQLDAQSNQQVSVVAGINAKKAEQQSLLAQTQGDEANYRKLADQDNAKIADLRRQQAAIIASFSSNVHYGGSGGYPWAGAPFPNSIADPWGMYQRQCVSYTAWKVASSRRHMPYWGGRGNAYQWPGNARAAGIPVDGNPRPGDVAISMAGSFCHAMYFESVNGGKVHVSQYNANWDGQYSTSDVSIAGLQFIHF